MRKVYKSLYFLIFVLNYSLANEVPSSRDVYQNVQMLREQANELIYNAPSKESLKEAKLILNNALGLLSRKEIRLLSLQDESLMSRKWDVIRDLTVLASLEGNVDIAMQYVEELSTSPLGLGWVKKELVVTNLLKDIEKFSQLVEVESAWENIYSTKGIKTDYKANLDTKEKVAGLALIWSEVKQGFVYFDQVPNLDWDQTFQDYLPRILESKNTQEYYSTLTKFISLLNDSHTNVYYPKNLRKHVYSKPPIKTKLVENQVVITKVYSQELRKLLHVGDVILEIDNQDVFDYAQKNISPYQSSSTPQDLKVRTYTYALLSGDFNKNIKLKINRSGSTLNLEIKRSGYLDIKQDKENQFTLIEDDIGYLDIKSFKDKELVSMVKAHIPLLETTKGLIIDIRENSGGNSLYGEQLLSLLTSKPIKKSRSFSRVNNSYSRSRGITKVEWSEIPIQSVNVNKEYFYRKPMIILTSAETFSAAEDFLYAFKQMNVGYVLGDITAGSSGQPAYFNLPGGGMLRVCVKRDLSDVGWIGKGITPDVTVKSSIKDIQENHDVALTSAVSMIREL